MRLCPRRIRLLATAGALLAWSGVLLADDPPGESSRPTSDWLRWEALEQFPEPDGISHAQIGIAGDALLVAGGVTQGKGQQQPAYSDAVFALIHTQGKFRWQRAGRLKTPLAYGASSSWKQWMICAGGRNDKGCSSEVFFLQRAGGRQKLRIQSLPKLPRAVSSPCAAVYHSTLFLAGGVNDKEIPQHEFWSLDLENPQRWHQEPSWDGAPRSGAALVAQSNGEVINLYLIGGKSADTALADAHCFDPRTRRWTSVSPVPRPVMLAAAVALGPSHVALFGGSQVSGDESFSGTFLYNPILDRWSQTTAAPQGVAATSAVRFGGSLVMVGGEPRPGVTASDTYRISMPHATRHLTPLDFLVLGSYLAMVMGVGIYCAGRGKTSNDYFLAGQRIPWWAAGISIMATQVSSIGFMAIPAKTFATDWLYFSGVFTWLIVVPIVICCFIPFFRQLRVTTAYQYLEQRFGRGVCIYAALVFSLAQLARMAVVVYLPALALASTTDLHLTACIVTMGLLATLYTVLGGMAAVVWTDVLQTIVLLGGAVLVLLWVALQVDGGPLAGLYSAYEANKLRIARFDWDISAPVLWVVLLGNIFSMLAELTSDQAIVQRYQSTPTERDAGNALWTHVALSVPWAFLVFALGTAIFVFYHHRPEALSPEVAGDGIVPLFVAQQLPAGISGLIIAAIFAAAMSSLDSSMHSTATVWTTDFYSRWFPESTDRSRVWLARSMVAVFGVFATATAIAMSTADIASLWDFFIRVTGPLMGGLCGLFVLGIFFVRANSVGAIFGAVVSVIITLSVDRFLNVHFLLYAPIGVISCVIFGYLASWLFPRQEHLVGLTYATRYANRHEEGMIVPNLLVKSDAIERSNS